MDGFRSVSKREKERLFPYQEMHFLKNLRDSGMYSPFANSLQQKPYQESGSKVI